MTYKITFLGQATWSLDIDGHTVLIDPFFNGNTLTEVSPDDVEADFIIVSHGHGDHVGDTVAIAKRTGAKVISNFEIGNWLMNTHGLENVHQQHLGGGFQHEFGHVKLTIAHHGSGLPDGSYGGSPAGLIITAASGKSAYFLCDTALFKDMELYAGPDVALVPIGDNFTMGPDDAVEAVKLIKPETAIPCHYNTWPLIEQDGAAWAERVTEETDAKGLELKPGDTFTLED
ncbi:MAG: metal-dependent hydrolase [Anaerolineae bacterium]